MPSMKIIHRDLVRSRLKCEMDGCEGTAQIHGKRKTRFNDLGSGPGPERSILDVSYGIYYCPECKSYFTQKIPEATYDRGHSKLTKRVHDKAVSLVLEDGQTQVDVIRHMNRQYGARIPSATLSDWVNRERKRRDEDGESD